MLGTGSASSRTIQKFTRYGSTVFRAGYGIGSSTLLNELHHALVLSFCFGTTGSIAGSSLKLPLRLRSTKRRHRSLGWSASAVASTGIHDDSSGPMRILPILAGRVAPAGSENVGSTSASATCVPYGLKFGCGPLPGAPYDSSTWTICGADCGAASSDAADKATPAAEKRRKRCMRVTIMRDMKRVLIPTKLDRTVRDTLEAHGGYSVILEEVADLAAFCAQHSDAHALIVRSEKVTPAIIDALPQLKAIVRAGSGVDTIDLAHARKKGVDVMSTPGANANAVAEEVVGLMLADARHLVAADPSTRAGKWEKAKFMGREISGKTIGIVGLGAIGRLVARRLSGFDVHLIGYDPIVTEEQARAAGVELVSLQALFERADYITLHVP